MEAKSKDYLDGYAAGLVFAMDVFESRSDAIYSRKWLRRKDIRMVVAILDAIFRARNELLEYGPRGMNLVFCRDGSFEFRKKETKKK